MYSVRVTSNSSRAWSRDPLSVYYSLPYDLAHLVLLDGYPLSALLSDVGGIVGVTMGVSLCSLLNAALATAAARK